MEKALRLWLLINFRATVSDVSKRKIEINIAACLLLLGLVAKL
jgi:hypothetical protein